MADQFNVDNLEINPKYIKMGIGGLALLAIIFSTFVTVPTGHRGVKVRFGKVIGEALPDGLHTKIPFIEQVVKMNVKTQRIQDVMEIYTRDIQQAKVNFSINYNLHKDQAHFMYQNVGKDWESIILTPLILKVSKDVFGKWDAIDLVESREKAGLEMLTQLQKDVEKLNITITAFSIENIDYSDVFEDAIEAKVVAAQRAIEAQNKTKQISEEAKQKLIAAEAEAKAMRIKARALSQNKALVNYEAVQKWDGKMPTVTGGATPFLNLDLKK